MIDVSVWIQKFIFFSENLSPLGLWFVLAGVLFFSLYSAYRTMGLGGMLGIMLIAFFVYVLYDHTSFKKFDERQKNEAIYMQAIERELQKE